MDSIAAVLQRISEWPVSQAARETDWVFPFLETMHVLAIVFVVGSITRLDLRLLGLVWQHRPVTAVANEMLPWTWTSFLIAAVFGFLLWSSNPVEYLQTGFFDVKMLLLLAAAINMLVFHIMTYRKVADWDYDPIPPKAVRVAGGLSMAFWIGVVICGRFIGFV